MKKLELYFSSSCSIVLTIVSCMNFNEHRDSWWLLLTAVFFTGCTISNLRDLNKLN